MHRIVAIPLGCIVVIFFATSLWAEDKPNSTKDPSPSTAIYEKIVSDNTKDTDKAYLAYQTALARSQDRILKALEAAKADLNDTRKYSQMSISDRAKAIDELSAREAAVKNGALAQAIETKDTAVAHSPTPPNGSIALEFTAVGDRTTKDSPIIPYIAGDGNFTIAKANDRCAITAINNFIYFKLDTETKRKLIGHKCIMMVQSSAHCTSLEYDSDTDAYFKCPENRTSSEDGVISAEFLIEKAVFSGRENCGTDCRLTVDPGCRIYGLEIMLAP